MSQILILSISSIFVFSDTVLVIMFLYFSPALCYLTQLHYFEHLPLLHTLRLNLTHEQGHIHSLAHTERRANQRWNMHTHVSNAQPY